MSAYFVQSEAKVVVVSPLQRHGVKVVLSLYRLLRHFYRNFPSSFVLTEFPTDNQ